MENKKFIPLGKQQKKLQKEVYAARRGSWQGVNPVTRVEGSRKYDRAKVKREAEQE